RAGGGPSRAGWPAPLSSRARLLRSRRPTPRTSSRPGAIDSAAGGGPTSSWAATAISAGRDERALRPVRRGGPVIVRPAVPRHVAQEGVDHPEEQADEAQEEEFSRVLRAKEHVGLGHRSGKTDRPP